MDKQLIDKKELINRLEKLFVTDTKIKSSEYDLGHDYGIQRAIVFADQLELHQTTNKMNEQYKKTIKNMKPPKYFTAITLKEAYKKGFETAKNEALFNFCLINEKQKLKEIATKYDVNDEEQPTISTPSHYQGTIQPIDLINAQNLNFNLGNVVKYVCRAGKKDGENVLSDLEKAKNYINYEIERVKNNEIERVKNNE